MDDSGAVVPGGDGAERVALHESPSTGRIDETVAAKPSTEKTGMCECAACGTAAGMTIRWNEQEPGAWS